MILSVSLDTALSLFASSTKVYIIDLSTKSVLYVGSVCGFYSSCSSCSLCLRHVDYIEPMAYNSVAAVNIYVKGC